MNFKTSFAAFFFFLSFALSSIGQVTYIVNTENDNPDNNPDDGICADFNGNCTLRAAITEANMDGQSSNIDMDGSLTSINLISSLPTLTEDNTNINGLTNMGRLGIVGNPSAPIGFTIDAVNCIIQDFTISNCDVGIHILNTANNTILLNNTIDFNTTGIDFEMSNGTINNCRIDNNNTAIKIASISNLNAQLHVINNTFSLNTQVIDAQNNPQNYQLSNNTMECNFLPFVNPGNISAPTITFACTSLVKGTAIPRARIEVFKQFNPDNCPTEPCQGNLLVGITRADENGNWTLPAICDGGLAQGDEVIAIATDESNSSSYSNCLTTSSGCQGETISILKVIRTEDFFLFEHGSGSLRHILNCANINPDIDTIHFDLVGNGPHIFQPLSFAFPLADDGIVIDGTSQPDYYPGKIRIEANLFYDNEAFTIDAPNCSIFGLEFSGFDDVASGTGILLGSTAFNTQIGAPNKGNIFGNNTYGVRADIEFDGLVVQSNYFGEYLPGVSIPNSYGIHLATFQSGNATALIGGNIEEGEGNMIANNTNIGISIDQVNIAETAIQGNTIYNNGTLTEAAGILITSSSNIIIGGSETKNNIIHSNIEGILMKFTSHVQIIFNQIYENMLDGIDIDDVTSTNNLISQNAIYCNGTGIDLNGVANMDKTAPTILSADPNRISGIAEANDIVEVFLKDDGQCAPLLFSNILTKRNEIQMNDCQGKIYLGTALTDVDGTWSLVAPFVTNLPTNAQITATASDFENNTSPFATCLLMSNDECDNAFAIPMKINPCVGGSGVTASTIGAIQSPESFALCTPPPNIQDVWLKVEPPYTGNFLLRAGAAVNDRIHIEAYHDASFCANLSPILCDTIQSTEDFLIFEGSAIGLFPNDLIYLRVWLENEMGPTAGTFNLAAHLLDSNPAEWNVLCDLEGGEIISDEFVVVFEDIATIADAEEVQMEMEAEGAVLLDVCYCGTPFLQLWQVADLIELAACRKTATSRTKVDTTEFNYLLGDVLCQGSGQVSPLFPFDYTPAPNAKDVTIAVIDTGVDEDHGLLSQFIWQDGGTVCFPEAIIGYDFVHNDPTPEDLDGHGTAVNGTFIRDMPNDIAPKLMNLKVYENGIGNVFDAVCAIRYAIANGVDIINLSWGLKRDSVPSLLKTVLDQAAAEDILIVTSSGNTSEDNDVIRKWPANYTADNIISVGAYEIDLIGQDTSLAFYSNFGRNAVDIAALGYVESTFLDNSVRTLGGTSLAAPLVARTAAIIRARYPCLSALDIKNCILNNATKVSDLKTRMRSGGALNHIRAMQCAALLAAECSVLSIGVGALTASSSNDGTVTISWEAEGLTEGMFYIKKSEDGFKWKNVGQMEANIDKSKYQFLDNPIGNTYYQIVFEAGEITLYSEILEVEIKDKNHLSLFPNPTFSKNIQVNVPKDFQNGVLEITDQWGHIIQQQLLEDLKETNTLNIHLNFDEKGLFFINVKNKGQVLSEKLLVF